MFEQPAGNVEKDRSRSIMILSGAAVLAVIVLIIVVTSIARRSPPLEWSRAGAPDFDSYAPLVLLTKETYIGERINIRYGRIKCLVQNSGDRVIEGLELRAAAVGLSNNVYVEKTLKPVPNIKDELGPHQSMDVEIFLEHIPERSLLSDITLEVRGLRLH